ncbi:hypothetical protein BGZ98_004227 [Dissophora globulifera]|nr:hypothetical protein BGZ98_004227 [Dissophora globulifera]
MSNPGTLGGAGFQSSIYPQPVGTFSSSTGGGSSSLSNAGTAGMSIAPTAPLTTAPAGTAPRKQLAAAAAAGAAAGSNKAGGRGAKGPNKKGGAGTGKRGGRGGGRGGGRSGGGGGGGGGGRGGGGGGGGGRDGGDDDDDDATGGKGKDSDDDNEDDPEVSIEEQFILRLPPGEMSDRFREKVIAREVDESVKLKFSDARRGTFTFEDLVFPTKLVDLPTIIEAQKTLNGKQMYKVADISQMLIVDPTPVEKTAEVKTEPSSTLHPNGSSMPAPSQLPPLKPSDYVWPDGLSNPLKNVRKRRFRKRVSKVAVEGVENEIERLLQEDALAEEVTYEIREQIDGMDRFDSDDAATPAPEGGHSDMDMDGEMMDIDEDDEEEDEDEDDLLAELERKIGGGENSSDDEEEEDNGTPQPDGPGSAAGSGSGITNAHMLGSGKTGLGDSKAGSAGGSGGHLTNPAGVLSSTAGGASLAAKLGDKGKAKSMAAGDGDDDEDEDDEDDEEEEEEDDDDDDSGSDEDDEDDDESAQMEKLLKDEIKELNSKVKDNQEKLQSAPNDILKRRFGSILDNLRKELELKTMQLEEAKERTKSKAK